MSIKQEHASNSHTMSIYKTAINFLLFFLVLALPSNILSNSFDGLPWANSKEILTLTLFVPMLILLDLPFFSKKILTGFFCVVLSLKFILLVCAPKAGINVWSYSNRDNLQNNVWEKTYESIWYGQVSDVMKKPYKGINAFPIEWINRLSPSERNEISAIVKLQTFIRPTLGMREICLVPSQGMGEASVFISNRMGIKQTIKKCQFNPQGFLLSNNVELKDGPFELVGEIPYKGEGWELNLLTLDKNTPSQPVLLFDRRNVFREQSALTYSDLMIRFFNLISKVVNILIYLLLYCWGMHAAFKIVTTGKSSPLILSLGIFHLLVSYFTSHTSYGIDGAFLVGLYVVEAILILLATYLFRKNKPSFDWLTKIQLHSGFNFVILYVPALLYCYYHILFELLETFKLYSNGNDWLSYQLFARKIFIDGEWLNAGERIFIHMPLYRYFVGSLHVLFGQTSFAQCFVDLWCVVAGALFTIFVGTSLSKDKLIGFLAGVLTLYCILAGRQGPYMLAGLQEFFAMSLQMATLYFILRYNQEEKNVYFMFSLVFGVLAFLARLDHLLILASFSVLFLFPHFRFELPTQRVFQKAFLYCCVLLCGVLLVFLRNYYVGGLFAINAKSNMNYVSHTTLAARLHNLWLIVTGYYSIITEKKSNIPFISLGFAFSLFLSLLSLVSTKFKKYSVFLLVFLFFGILPYFFVKTEGYEPRFLVHLIPLTSISFVLGCYLLFFSYIAQISPPSKEESKKFWIGSGKGVLEVNGDIMSPLSSEDWDVLKK